MSAPQIPSFLKCSKEQGKSRPASEFSLKPNGKYFRVCDRCRRLKKGPIRQTPSMTTLQFLPCAKECGKELPVERFSKKERGNEKGQWHRNCDNCRRVEKVTKDRKQREKVEGGEKEKKAAAKASEVVGGYGVDGGNGEQSFGSGYGGFGSGEGLASGGVIGGRYEHQQWEPRYGGYDLTLSRELRYDVSEGHYPEEGIHGVRENM